MMELSAEAGKNKGSMLAQFQQTTMKTQKKTEIEKEKEGESDAGRWQ